MARQVFFSFHYKPDNWRASQVRNMGVIEGNAPVSDNDWEAVTKKGDQAIRDWIANQLSGRSCAVVLVGENTAGRKWINHEITEAWNAGKGVVEVFAFITLRIKTKIRQQKEAIRLALLAVATRKCPLL